MPDTDLPQRPRSTSLALVRIEGAAAERLPLGGVSADCEGCWLLLFGRVLMDLRAMEQPYQAVVEIDHGRAPAVDVAERLGVCELRPSASRVRLRPDADRALTSGRR